MSIKIVVPNKSLCGEHVGLYFVDGVAEVEDEKFGREIAKSFGYEIVEEEKKEESKKTAPKKTATKKTVKKKEESNEKK